MVFSVFAPVLAILGQVIEASRIDWREATMRPPVGEQTIDPQTGFPSWVECVAVRTGPREFRAVCVDLALGAESDVSVLDAQERLEAKILTYLVDAYEAGFPAEMANRRISSTASMKLHWRLIMRGLQGVLGTDADRAVWRQPIPNTLDQVVGMAKYEDELDLQEFNQARAESREGGTVTLEELERELAL